MLKSKLELSWENLRHITDNERFIRLLNVLKKG